jgi:Na+/melibiose symporter-like transporter
MVHGTTGSGQKYILLKIWLLFVNFSFLCSLQVCDDQKCQEEVPLIAVNYMDRILNQRRSTIKKSHLQLLASACLLIASKLREPSCRALPVGLLVYYTDYSISKKDLIVSIHFFSMIISKMLSLIAMKSVCKILIDLTKNSGRSVKLKFSTTKICGFFYASRSVPRDLKV